MKIRRSPYHLFLLARLLPTRWAGVSAGGDFGLGRGTGLGEVDFCPLSEMSAPGALERLCRLVATAPIPPPWARLWDAVMMNKEGYLCLLTPLTAAAQLHCRAFPINAQGILM